MATGSTNASPSNSTDALFRGWATAVSNGFSNSGWVQTGDTGQINLTTVTRPLAANTSMGYQIWRMADTLQSTKPIFVKIEYGSSGATNRPGLWFHIGTGSDGAGNITGRIWDSRENSANAVMGTAGDSTTADTVYYWGNTGAVAMCLFGAGIGPNYVMAFSIERTRDRAGAVTGEGVTWIATSGSGTPMVNNRTWFFDQDQGLIDPETGLIYVLTGYNSTISNPADIFRDLDTSPVYTCRDVVQPWSRTWLVTRSTSIYTTGATLLVYPKIDGTQRTYRVFGALGINHIGADTNVYVMMRWNDDTY